MLLVALALSHLEALVAAPLAAPPAALVAAGLGTNAPQDGAESLDGADPDGDADAERPPIRPSRVPQTPLSPGLGPSLRTVSRPEAVGRATVDLRVVEGIDADRSRVALLATYALTDRLTVGVEAGPKDDEFGPYATYRVVDETTSRPAVVVGTSSDRIGTPSGRSFWTTVSKSFEEEIGFGLAPYVGLAWGDFEDELELIGGVRIDWTAAVSTTSLWDGEELHHALEVEWSPNWRTSLLAIDDGDGRVRAGISVGASF